MARATSTRWKPGAEFKARARNAQQEIIRPEASDLRRLKSKLHRKKKAGMSLAFYFQFIASSRLTTIAASRHGHAAGRATAPPRRRSR